MIVLVLNVGSTSVKHDLYDMETEATLASGKTERLGEGGARAAIEALLGELKAGPLAGRTLSAVGHRVVHGGERLVRPVRVDDEVKRVVADCARYAPLHNPANLAGIAAAEALLPDVPQVAVFDTAFHGELPPAAYLYGVPYEQYLAHGVRRYGFHGPSHQYLSLRAAEQLGRSVTRLKLITCHLGGGASVCAIDGGRSVDVSMGLTPLEGLVMGTRSGDLDPALPLLFLRQGLSPDEIDQLLNKRSGLLGLSGVSADFRDVEQAAEAGHARARLAIEVFVHRLRKYIGAAAATLGGADAIVFSGGIGENSARVRAAACEGLLFMGVSLDAARNAAARPAAEGGVVDVADRHARTRVLVVETDEERMIARETVRCLKGPSAAVRAASARPIPVGVSVRHVHLSRRDCDALFGPGYELTPRNDVTQPGQYVTRETVDLIGPKDEIRRVAIINPLRKETQVELARSDARRLGVDPPLRGSGDLDGTPGLRLRGPAGEIEIDHGVILAHRHVHMHPRDAAAFGVRDKQLIKVRIEGDREMTMGDVLVRVSDQYALDLHLDTDEANAASLGNDSVVAFDGVQDG